MGMEAWHVLERLPTEFSLPVTADVVDDLKEIIRDAVSQIDLAVMDTEE